MPLWHECMQKSSKQLICCLLKDRNTECMCLSPQLLLVGCPWETLYIANYEHRDVFAEALEELVVGILTDQKIGCIVNCCHK